MSAIEWQLNNVAVSILAKSLDAHQSLESLHANELAQASAIKSEGRKNEFVRSRNLLHHKLPGTFDFSREQSGLIAWPNGWLGTVSHSQGHVAVGITNHPDTLGLGIDLESTSRVRPELSKKICLEHEWKHILSMISDGESRGVLAYVFAAKEALYKALYPLGRTQFWFEDAEVTHITSDLSKLEIKLLMDVAPNAKKGDIFGVAFKRIELDEAEFVCALCTVLR